ncbi:MAG: DUF3306 domain-containing protein [Hyphomicrobiales bacterium]|nr:DUF3306 domain-containing protein [Hyphomicrobiales bacterium]
MSNEKKGFAARWSERKIADGQDGDNYETEKITSLPDGQEHEKTEGNNQVFNGPLTEADFDDVDFDALDKSSDYTRFVQTGVPQAIQKKALRKLWASDSVFEVLDGMNDYDEDFTGDGLAGKAFKTAYKIGRGYFTDEETEDDGNKIEEISLPDNKAGGAHEGDIDTESVAEPVEDKTTKTGTEIT